MRRMPLPAHSLRAATGVQGWNSARDAAADCKNKDRAEIRDSPACFSSLEIPQPHALAGADCAGRCAGILPVRECPVGSPLLNRVMARLLELRGLSCPAAVEEIELFADAADERLLAWAFCGREADKRDLLRWAEALERELPEISGVTFFSSRRRSSERRSPERRLEDEAPIDPTSLAQSGAKTIRYRTKNHEYQVSAGAFFQVNRYLCLLYTSPSPRD